MIAGRPKAPPRGALAVPAAAANPTPATGTSARPISSDALFAGASEVQIVHRGSLYRLKQTALGKLILTK